MCGGNNTPDSTPPGNPPGGSTSGTALCCTCDAEDTISRGSRGVYFTVSGYTSSQKTNKCKIEIARTTSGGTVTITKTFSLSYSNVEDDDRAAAETTVTGALTAAMANWTAGASSYKCKIDQTGCDPQELSIEFKSEIAASDADVSVTVDGTATGPSTVTGGTRMHFKLQGEGDDDSWTMTHEVGHTFGLPDEYCTIDGVPINPPPTEPGARTIDPPAAAPTTTYIGCPPQADVTITQTANRPSTRHPGKYIFDNASVMGQSGNTTYPANLFYWVAIEVKKILVAEGASANVSIV